MTKKKVKAVKKSDMQATEVEHLSKVKKSEQIYYTPGQWVSERCGKNTIKVFKSSDNRRIATISIKTLKMDEANARLIAASPILLEACKDIKSLIDLGYAEKVISAPNNFHVNLDKALKQIGKAITKAEGGE